MENLLSEIPNDHVHLIILDLINPSNTPILMEEYHRLLMNGGFLFVLVESIHTMMEISPKIEESGFKMDFSPLFQSFKILNDDNKIKSAMVLVAMKELSENTFVDQALYDGMGISWLDDGRIPPTGSTDEGGRFPSNLLVFNNALDDVQSKKKNDKPLFSRFFSIESWWNRLVKELEINPSIISYIENEGILNKVKLVCYLITLGSREECTVLDALGIDETISISCNILSRKYLFLSSI